MTPEERLKKCSICKNRGFNPQVGLICGNIGAKPTFAEECPDFNLDVVAQEKQKKNATELEEKSSLTPLSRAILFGAISFITFGSLSFLANFIIAYNQAAYLSFARLICFVLVWTGFCGYFCIYAIYAYIKKKPDMIFVSKYLAVIGTILGLSMLAISPEWEQILMVAGVCVTLFLYLTFSKDINNWAPKEDCKFSKLNNLNKIMLVVSIVAQLTFYISIIGVSKSNAANLTTTNEKTLNDICLQNKKKLPSEPSPGLYWIDMKFNGNEVEYIYKFKEGNSPDEEPMFADFAELINKGEAELMKQRIPDNSKADKLFGLLANTDKYGLRFKYFSPKGSLVYDLQVPNSEIKRLISQGYYTTKRADFLEIIDIFNKLLPKIEFFDGVKFRKCSLSADGKTLHLDLRLYGDTVESLAELKKHLRGQIINVMLPNMLGDYPVLLAMLNQMNISFNHTSDDVASWKLDILIKPSDYKSLLTQ